jgi:hypothetical protein
MRWAIAAIGLVVILAGVGLVLRLRTLISYGVVPPVKGSKFQRGE